MAKYSLFSFLVLGFIAHLNAASVALDDFATIGEFLTNDDMTEHQSDIAVESPIVINATNIQTPAFNATEITIQADTAQDVPVGNTTIVKSPAFNATKIDIQVEHPVEHVPIVNTTIIKSPGLNGTIIAVESKQETVVEVIPPRQGQVDVSVTVDNATTSVPATPAATTLAPASESTIAPAPVSESNTTTMSPTTVSTTTNATTAATLDWSNTNGTTNGGEIPVLPGLLTTTESPINVTTPSINGTGTNTTGLNPATNNTSVLPTAVTTPTHYILVRTATGYVLVPVALKQTPAAPPVTNTVTVPVATKTVPATATVTQPFSGLALLYPGTAASSAVGSNINSFAGVGQGYPYPAAPMGHGVPLPPAVTPILTRGPLGSIPSTFPASPFMSPFTGANNMWLNMLRGRSLPTETPSEQEAKKVGMKQNVTFAGEKPILQTDDHVTPAPVTPPPFVVTPVPISTVGAAQIAGTSPSDCYNKCFGSVCQTVCQGRSVQDPDQRSAGTFMSWNKAF